MKRFLVMFLALAVVMPSTASAKTRLIFKDTIIEGEIQKPEITVYITRQNLNKAYDLELKESFLPKIVQALDSAPF